MKLKYYILAVTTISLTVMLSCGGKTKPTSKDKTTDSAEVFLLQKETINKELHFPGELIPVERADIFAKVTGYVSTIKVDLGDRVKTGQVIAVLDAPEVIANYAQANSDMLVAKSKYIGSLDAYQRIKNASVVKGTIAAGELERSKAIMQSDSASFEASKSKLQAYAQLRDYLTIRAPFNGIITQRNVDPGALVGLTSTKPMLVVENNTLLRLRIPVPEAYTSSVLDDASIAFTVDAYPGQSFQAELSRKSGSINLTNRTETWEFIYNNKEGLLKSGMFANAVINFQRPQPTFMAPLTAVVTTNEKRFVIRLKSSKAEWIDVRTGIAVDNKVEIFGLLTSGDTLLNRATDEIKPGISLYPKFTQPTTSKK